MSDRHSKWVDDGQRVQAIFGPGGLYAEGVVVAYCNAPSVIIRKDDGEKIHWRADMCRETAKPCGDLEGNTGLRCTRPTGHSDWHNAVADSITGSGDVIQVQWPSDQCTATAPKVFDDEAGAR